VQLHLLRSAPEVSQPETDEDCQSATDVEAISERRVQVTI
jgi:hypothetical protein